MTKDRTVSRAKRVLALLLASTVIVTLLLSACGGGGSSSGGGGQQNGTLSGNWQFTMTSQTDGNPGDPTFNGGLQGGFFLQNSGTVTGQTVYSIISSTSTVPCNSGSAPVSITISGQNVTITEVAGTQTFTLTGTLSTGGSTMTGTYTSTAGTASDGSPCGYAETGLSWSAVSVPILTGPVQGFFHSKGNSGSGLQNQDFPLTGSLTQGQNIGASNATVTGTLTFINPETSLSAYPCFGLASVNGQISGSTVVLHIIGMDGSNLGQIGGVPGSGVNAVTFVSTPPFGNVLQSGVTPGYAVISKACPGGGGLTSPGDAGNLCLALNSQNACQQPFTLTPAFLNFPSQLLNTASATQTITLTNNSSSPLPGLTLNFDLPAGGGFFYGGQSFSDFNGVPNFAAQDTCVPGGETLPSSGTGSQFSLNQGVSCTITVTFTPQEGCPWLPFANGVPPSPAGAPPQYCPFPVSAAVTLDGVTPRSDDNDGSFAIPVTGIGLSSVQPSTRELDFGAEAVSEASVPQTLSFTNNSASSVQILGTSSACTSPLPRPLLDNGTVGGLQVVGSPPGVKISIQPDGNLNSILYACDSDPGTLQPNFQISSDTCTGSILVPQSSCSLLVSYVPQPTTDINGGLDYFLELNTLQCTNAPGDPPSPPNCEIDSGRFPVELKTNTPSPLRMSPGAGLDFGNQTVGKASTPLQITLLNDPTLPNAQAVTFIGKILVSGNYSESDDCPVSLAPGSSCALTVTFKPGSAGFIPGTVSINYSPAPNNSPQFVFLRGTGQ